MNAGDVVLWHHEMRGGYGFIEHISAVVLKVNAKTVRIQVPLRDGTTVARNVNPVKLTPRGQPCAEPFCAGFRRVEGNNG